MEQALRAVERLAEEQRSKIEELQRGQLLLEQALIDIRDSKVRSSADPDAPRSNPQLRRRTPPPTQSRSMEDDAYRTPRSEVSSRTPRSQLEPPTSDGSKMVRSSTTPQLTPQPRAADDSGAHEVHYKRYRDDPRYRETGKQYGPWPPYPEWQDLPLRRFGMGFGKKGVKEHGASGGDASIKVGGEMAIGDKKRGMHGCHELVDGMVRGIGHGRRKFEHMNVNTDHFDAGFVPMAAKDEKGRSIDGLDTDLGLGKHHYYIKDHLNEEWSMSGDTATGESRSQGGSSRQSRSRRSYAEGSSRSSGSRSAR